MTDLNEYIKELLSQGYHCSQVMMQLSLALRQEDNPLLLRSMGGLGGGMYSRRTCGTLTGAACVLASYIPRSPGEPEPELYQDMVRELVEWFEEQHHSLDCRDLVEPGMASVMSYCPGLMARTFEKVMEILESHGIDPQTTVTG